MDAVLKFMSVFAEDQRFLNLHLDQEKEEINMCVILDRIENRGIEKGIEKGMEKGMELGMQLLECLWKEDRTEEISRVREDKDYRRKLLKEYGLI